MADDNRFVDLNKSATKAGDNREQKGGKGIILGLIMAFLLLIIIVVILILLIKDNRDIFGGITGNDSESVPTATVTQKADKTQEPTGVPEEKITPSATEAPKDPVAAKHCADLKSAIDLSGINDRNDAKAFVSTVNGNECLMISFEPYVITVRNDYILYGTDSYYSITVSDGRIEKTFDWPYIIDEDTINCFVPEVADFIGNGRDQLAFVLFTPEGKSSNSLHVIAAKDMLEYYVINPSDVFADSLYIDTFYDAGSARIAKIVANDKQYFVALPYMSLEEAYDTFELKTGINNFYTVHNGKISVSCLVSLTNAGYIGEIRSAVTFTSRDLFQASAPFFYLYTDDDFSDKDHMGIVTPLTLENAKKERVATVGANGERILVELTDYPRTTLDPDKYVTNTVTGLKEYIEDGKNIALFGVDVSRWNETIDWKKAKEAGVDFAIIRAAYRGTSAEGNIYTDTYFEDNIKKASENGIKIGAYFFSQAVTVEEAIEEADYIVKVLEPYRDLITFPVAFDTEKADNARANDMSADERTAVTKAFCERIKASGYKPMIYFSTVWSLMYLNMEELKDYDIWYAYYSDDIYYPYDYKIWQYTSTGSLSGFSGSVDMNVCFKDYSKE